MGLDMYLNAKRYLFNQDDGPLKQAIHALFGDRVASLKPQGLSEGPTEVEFRAAYWRKANAVHKWFVDNVQGGNDDCREYEVSRDELKTLRELCQDILDKQRPPSELPPQAGFFFGSTDIDESYYEDLRDTVAQIDGALAASNDFYFTYQSSW